MCGEKVRYFFSLRRDISFVFSKVTPTAVDSKRMLEQIHIYLYSSFFPILFPHLALT